MKKEYLNDIQVVPGAVIYRAKRYTDIRKLSSVMRRHLFFHIDHKDLCFEIYCYINRYYMSQANQVASKIKKRLLEKFNKT